MSGADSLDSSGEMFGVALRRELDRFEGVGKIARLWLRDDDAVEPTPALDTLLSLCDDHAVPLALAVIPEPTGPALAERLAAFDPDIGGTVSVTVHGWAHADHAGEAGKKRELGLDRAREVVLGELARGFDKLSALHGDRLQPVLVPPWNRIDAALLPYLQALGFRAVSVYGSETKGWGTMPALPLINTHVDVIDWHGNRGCRDWALLEAEIVARLATCLNEGGSTGLLTHHLVHDVAVWAFLDRLFQATSAHPACRWVGIGDLLARTSQ